MRSPPSAAVAGRLATPPEGRQCQEKSPGAWTPPALSPLVVHVINKHDVYIGRGGTSPWGNPYKLSQIGSRLDAIRLYEEWVRSQPEMVARIKRELKGRVLGCWCRRPKNLCHGDVLVRISLEVK